MLSSVLSHSQPTSATLASQSNCSFVFLKISTAAELFITYQGLAVPDVAQSFAVEVIVGIVADSNAYDQSKRMRTGGDYTHTGYSSPSLFHPPLMPAWGSHGYMAPPPPPPPPYDPYGAYPVPSVPMPAPAPVPAPNSYAHV